MSRVLDVYFQDTVMGQLLQTDAGTLSFQYNETYLDTEQQAASICMPLRAEAYCGDEVKAFFSGLLPDDNTRHQLARYLGVSEKNPFALLEIIGGECAGALSFYPEGITPAIQRKNDSVVLTDTQLQNILKRLKRRPLLANEDGMRLSLAGAQDKIAVGYQAGKISLIKGTTPTTHILKPAIEDVNDSVHNELFCMRLAKLVGIDTPAVDIHWALDKPCFLVERYDREPQGNHTLRLHQEDFCQAQGMLPDIKYEREGGPSITSCQALLRQHSCQPAADQLKLLKRIVFNYLIGNADAHGKNFALLYKQTKPQLAPAYDLLCTAVYPEVSSKMAMKIGGKYDPQALCLRHWQRLVADTAAARKNLDKLLQSLLIDTLKYAETLKIQLAQTGITSSIYDDICNVIATRAKRLARLLEK